jgi:hypothetical protein
MIEAVWENLKTVKNCRLRRKASSVEALNFIQCLLIILLGLVRPHAI